MRQALLIIDVQNDFMPGGALPVPDAYRVIQPIQRLISSFDQVIATQDWHPEDHISFVTNHLDRNVGDQIAVEGGHQKLWPRHCVQGERGAALVPLLPVEKIDHILLKGIDLHCDCYSAFFDTQGKTTGLSSYLKERKMEELHVVGVATDVCVYFSVLDALKEGFSVCVHEEGCAGLSGHEAALSEMKRLGAQILR